jgi:hypothetical protein
MSCAPDRSTCTGNRSTNRTKTARAGAALWNDPTFDPDRRNPIPIPRKLPSKTKFEKYER